jgi:hypothetical protein
MWPTPWELGLGIGQTLSMKPCRQVMNSVLKDLDHCNLVKSVWQLPSKKGWSNVTYPAPWELGLGIGQNLSMKPCRQVMNSVLKDLDHYNLVNSVCFSSELSTFSFLSKLWKILVKINVPHSARFVWPLCANFIFPHGRPVFVGEFILMIYLLLLSGSSYSWFSRYFNVFSFHKCVSVLGTKQLLLEMICIWSGQ